MKSNLKINNSMLISNTALMLRSAEATIGNYLTLIVDTASISTRNSYFSNNFKNSIFQGKLNFYLF